MCGMAHCGRVVDWRHGNLPGRWMLGLSGLLVAWLCLLDAACCSLQTMYACSCLLICNCMIFSYDMMLLMCMILYMVMQMLLNMYMLLYVHMLMYMYLLYFFMRHMMKFSHWWQHISCQLDGQFNIYVCVYVYNVLQIWFSFSDFIFRFGNLISIFWFGFSVFIFWFENLKSNIDKSIFVCYNQTRKSKLIFTGGIHNG